ncbi:hypothetical protein Pcinc_010784 [Petrolisthes cinctipes]|uniref:Uncharacterized protein n=1 Tax=Petrolisthes cinctipes TaxID=88211 RepID=A0AAE1G4L7_PETCI|nr:hypothetical protein Pcinc_010784 [Petrolisthes cinctipes]
MERPIRSRSNGKKQKQEATSVLLLSSRPKSSCLERASPRLEQMESNLFLPSKVVTTNGALVHLDTEQAQSNWKVFQQWLLADISDITEDVIVRFLIYLDESTQNGPPPSGKESRSPTDKQPYLSKDNFFSKIRISITNLRRPTIIFPVLHTTPLCPWNALDTFLKRTAGEAHQRFIFVHPTSFKPLKAGRLSYWLDKAIKTADISATSPAGHDVRKFGHSIAFARQEDPATIMKNGFWHSPNVFVNKYLFCPGNTRVRNFVAGRITL